MQKELIIVIGAYGSGKSEYSVNLAVELKKSNDRLSLVDLDVVNPYFRSRDLRDEFEQKGIRVVAPEGDYRYGDLPMLSPAIMGVIQDTEDTVILDVGGDPAGCRTLARYIPHIRQRGYKMHFVINTRRPFTGNTDEIIQMKRILEETSGLEISHLICNTNLMELTDRRIIEQGIDIISEVAEEFDLVFEHFLVLDLYDKEIPSQIRGKSKKVMNYYLNKPWEVNTSRGI